MYQTLNIFSEMKTIFFKIILFVFASITWYSCDKTDPNVAPPPMSILTSDTTKTLGELIVKPYYRTGYNNQNTLHAPKYTDVVVYASATDYEKNIPLFKTYTFDSDSIYFGFLDSNPLREYYVWAGVTDGGDRYEASNRVLLYPGKRTVHGIIMEKVVKPQK